MGFGDKYLYSLTIYLFGGFGYKGLTALIAPNRKNKKVTIMRRITNFNHLVALVAVFATIMMVSCFKDEVVSTPALRVESEAICFSTDVKWADEDEITRGGGVSNRVGKHDLKSADGEFTLPMGVYVEDGIGCADAAETRGAKVDSKDAISNFNVWATLTKTDNTVINYFSNVAYEKNTDNVFFPVNEADEYYWPGSGKLDFTAVANVPTSGFTTTMAGNALASFDYTVPTDATAQPDIMVANADDVNGNLGTSVPLTFKHIMSAVNIQIGKVVKGEIRSITLTGVYNKATYNVSTGKWNIDTTSKDNYSVKFADDGDSNDEIFTTTGDQVAGTDINANNATFMFIPQEPAEGAEMIIEFLDTTTGRLYSDAAGAYKPALRGSIAGDIWDMAKTTNYRLSIDESFTLTVEPTGKKLDAHYIITEVNVTVDGIANWTITATSNDGQSSQLSILPKSKANPLAQQGFWTDKVVNASGVETTESARGAQSYSGSGNLENETFLLFIPENINDKDREIKIILSSSDPNKPAETTKILLQKYPNWTGDIGWEVVDDDERGKYGFKWTRKVAYAYRYASLLNRHEQSCKNLINEYGAGANGFATTGTYWHSSSVGFRPYILLDYSVLNNVTGADSSTEGFNNTLALYRAAGGTSTSQFETVIKNMKKVESGKEGQNAYGLPTQTEINEGCPAESGTNNDLSAIMEYIQKKNRYCLQKKNTTGSDGETGVLYIPFFQEKDLKWFLPAYGQFTGVDFTPENTTDSAADYWSSTTAGASTAYIGSGDEKDRDLEFAVIAVRVNENGYGNVTVSEISTEEMAGGENGEAQWVN